MTANNVRRRLAGGVAVLLWMAQGACAPPSFVRLRSTLTVNARPGDEAEVVAGREVSRLRGMIARVAVSAPDECVDFDSVGESGVGSEEASILHQRCAVELATLERSLTAAGYSVVSWRQLRDVVSSSRSPSQEGAGPLAVLQAARLLGAQLILDVNALDWITRARSAVDARWERTIFASDAAGAAGQPLTEDRFLPESLSSIERYASAAEDEFLLRTRRGAGLNLTVVSTEAGQTLLFYRRFLVEPHASRAVVNVLLQRSEGEYTAVSPSGLVVRQELSTFRPSVTVSRVSRPDAFADDTHHRLLQELVDDCVAQITSRLGPPAAVAISVPSEPRPTEARREEPPPPPPPPPSPPPQTLPLVGVATPGEPPPAPTLPVPTRSHRRRHRE